MLKKLLCFCVSLAISACMLSACGGSDSSSNASSGSSDNSASSDVTAITPDQAASVEINKGSMTIDGQTVDTSDLVVMSIGGYDIKFDEFRYYWLTYSDSYKEVGADLSDPEVLKAMKTTIENELLGLYGVLALGRDNGVTFDDEIQKQADDAYNSLIGNFTSLDGYKDALEEAHMTDALIREHYYDSYCYSRVGAELTAPNSPLAKTKEDFLAAVDNGDFCKTLNLLVPYSCGAELTEEDKEGWDELTVSQKSAKYNSAYELLTNEEKEKAKAKAKSIADEVLAKVNAGEDFYQLMSEYNLDPGMTPKDAEDVTSVDGYYITKDYSFVQEYIDGAFALEENQTSGLVETSYGYHIIKRLPLDMDYINENADSMAEEYSTAYINKAINDYMDAVEIKYCEYYDKLTADSIT